MSSFTDNCIEFHIGEDVSLYSVLLDKFPDEEMTNKEFGVLTFTADKVSAEERDIIIFFTLDISSSMDERDCIRSTKRKIDYVKHTMNNILKKISEVEDINVQICIITFSTEAQILLETTEITAENVDEIIATVMSIEADGTTNIEKAFELVRKQVHKCGKNSGETKIIHINMTDGEITSGEQEPERLQLILNQDIDNVFIGFGKDHDAIMLKTLSGIKNGEYRFVDNLENTGMVYGEILHNILYTATECTYLAIENGKVYDWENNRWTDYLYIGNVYSEQQRHFQIICENTLDMRAHIFYFKTHPLTDMSTRFLHCEICDIFPHLIDENHQRVENNLTHFMFRQKTQQLLSELRAYNKKTYMANKNKIVKPHINRSMKNKMEQLMKLIMDTMPLYSFDDKDKGIHKMLKLLCDDLYVSHKTIGTPHSYMYSCARETSQGRQTTYTVALPDNLEENETCYSPGRFGNTLRRQMTCTMDYDDFDGENVDETAKSDMSTILESYRMMDTLDTPFSTQKILDFMEEINE